MRAFEMIVKKENPQPIHFPYEYQGFLLTWFVIVIKDQIVAFSLALGKIRAAVLQGEFSTNLSKEPST